MNVSPSDARSVLAALGISKAFGSHVVLDDVSFTVGAGEIVSVVGENGAGKSTFAKILAGLVAADKGTLTIDGKPFARLSPRQALAHGIGFIPQELAFVPEMTVAENVLLNQWRGPGGFISPRRTVDAAEMQLATMGVQVDPNRRMATMRLAEQQMIEIVKVMSRDIKVLILDEPTASLSQDESDRLMEQLRALARRDLGIVLISHRFDEVLDVSHRVDVFRNARRVHSAPPSELSASLLVEHMLGQQPASLERPRTTPGASPLLQIRNWHHQDHPRLQGVDLDVCAGEVVCLFGVRGSGAEVVAEGLGGRGARVTGSLSVMGREIPIPRSPREAIRRGIAFLPPDRKRQGLVLGRPIDENMTYLVPKLVSKRGFIQRRRQAGLARTWGERVRLRGAKGVRAVGDLSGGNQQKVLLASRLITEPKILVLEEPTRGVDVGARIQIHRVLREAAREGAAVLLITPDVEEAAIASTRVVAIRYGRVVGELSGDRITQTNLLLAVSQTQAGSLG